MEYLLIKSLPYILIYGGIPFVVLFLILWSSPIALNAFKETVRQPYFLVVVFVSIFLLGIVSNLPLFTEQEDNVRMVRDMGLATATLCGLIVAIFSASTSITEELEKKTAMTVLSKPVTRGHFIIGKYFGVVATSALAILIVGSVFILFLNVFGETLQQGESLAARDPLTRQSALNRLNLEYLLNIKLMVPGLFLAFLQVSVLAGVCVVFATRFNTILNVVITSLIYVVGHIGNWLFNIIQQSKAGVIGQGAGVMDVSEKARRIMEAQNNVTLADYAWKVFYAVFPNLENFNASLSLSAGKLLESRLIDSFKYKYTLHWNLEKALPSIPDFILANTVYAVVYISALLVISVLLLRNREIG